MASVPGLKRETSSIPGAWSPPPYAPHVSCSCPARCRSPRRRSGSALSDSPSGEGPRVFGHVYRILPNTNSTEYSVPSVSESSVLWLPSTRNPPPLCLATQPTFEPHISRAVLFIYSKKLYGAHLLKHIKFSNSFPRLYHSLHVECKNAMPMNVLYRIFD